MMIILELSGWLWAKHFPLGGWLFVCSLIVMGGVVRVSLPSFLDLGVIEDVFLCYVVLSSPLTMFTPIE